MLDVTTRRCASSHGVAWLWAQVWPFLRGLWELEEFGLEMVLDHILGELYVFPDALYRGCVDEATQMMRGFGVETLLPLELGSRWGSWLDGLLQSAQGIEGGEDDCHKPISVEMARGMRLRTWRWQLRRGL